MRVAGRIRHVLAGFADALIVFVPIAAFPLAFLFFGPQHVSGVVRQQDVFVTDLYNFVVPTRVMLLVPGAVAGLSQAWTGGDAESNGYVGSPLIALLGFITIRWRSQPMLSLGPHLHVGGNIHFHIPLPWLVLQRLPLFDNAAPARLMLFSHLLAGIAVAFVRELRRRPTGWRGPVGWVLVAVSLVALLPAVPWPATPNPVPAFFSGSGVTRIPAGSVALVAVHDSSSFQPGPGQDSSNNPMLWQVAAGMRYRMPEGSLIVPDVNGAPTGGRPPASATQTLMIAIQRGFVQDLTPDQMAAVRADLVRWQVQTVIVGPMYNLAGMGGFFTSLLGRDPQSVGCVLVWWDVQP